MEQVQQTRGARPRRPRRSREEVSEALVSAAASLFAERQSGHVSVRDIAARADVNPTYVHRYFGSKQVLMHVAIQRAQERIAARVDRMPDVVEGAAAVVHATLQEKELIATVARGILDGVVDGASTGDPATGRLLQRFQDEVASRGVHPVHDTRVVVVALAAATAGYALFGPFLRHGTGLDDLPEDQVEAEFVALLQEIARLALRQ